MAMSLAKNGGSEAAAETDLRVFLLALRPQPGAQFGLAWLGPWSTPSTYPKVLFCSESRKKSPGYVYHPDDNGTANFKSHNTYLVFLSRGAPLRYSAFVGY